MRGRVSSLVAVVLSLTLVAPPASAETTEDQAWQLAGATLCLQSMVKGLPGGLLGVGAAIAGNPSCAITIWNGATQLDAILQECVYRQPPNDACSHLDLSPLSGLIPLVQAAEPTPRPLAGRDLVDRKHRQVTLDDLAKELHGLTTGSKHQAERDILDDWYGGDDVVALCKEAIKELRAAGVISRCSRFIVGGMALSAAGFEAGGQFAKDGFDFLYNLKVKHMNYDLTSKSQRRYLIDRTLELYPDN